jgi:2-polyprenyl-6-methoxyphenol hydroxylase-like FAD-dependent oxidoreductase
VWGITGRDRQRRVFNAYAPLVVGADGVRSTIAEAVRAPVIRQGRGVGAVWYTYVSGLPNLGYRWYYRPGATAGIIPTNDGLTCVFAGMHARAFRAAAGDGSTQGRWGALLDALIAAGPNAVGELRRAMPAERVRGWPGMASYVRAAHGLGWALVGDAGYFKDPMGAHGITQALRDAQLLVEAILAAHGGEEPIARSLARYQHIRDELSAELFAVVDEIAAYTWDSRRADKLLRGLSAAMEPEIGHLAPTPARPGVNGARAGG